MDGGRALVTTYSRRPAVNLRSPYFMMRLSLSTLPDARSPESRFRRATDKMFRSLFPRRISSLSPSLDGRDSVMPLSHLQPARFSAVLQIFSSAEGCGCLAEGLRFDCVQYGSFTFFAEYLRFPAVVCSCKTAKNWQLESHVRLYSLMPTVSMQKIV